MTSVMQSRLRAAVYGMLLCFMVGVLAGRGEAQTNPSRTVLPACVAFGSCTGASSGTVLKYDVLIASDTHRFEYIITGAPTTSSIVLQACMRGGTCSTLNTDASAVNAVHQAVGIWDYFTVTPTFTGGTSPKLQVNVTTVGGADGSADTDNRTTATLTATCANANTSCDGTAGSQLKVSTNGFSLATVTVNGTYSGSTLNFDFSDDGGVNWYGETCTRSDVATQENSEPVTANATRAWDCGVAASGFFRVRQSALSTGSPNVAITLSTAQEEPAPTVSLHGQTAGIQQDGAGGLGVFILPDGSSLAAIAPRVVNGAVTTAVQVNAAATNVYGWSLYNPNASVCYVQMFGLPSASVTLGTTTPLLVIPLPASSADVHFAVPHIRGASGFTIAATTTPTGLTTCATGVVATIF